MARTMWARRSELRSGDDDLIFVSSRGGRIDPLNPMVRMLKPAAVRAGLGEWVDLGGGKLRAETWGGLICLDSVKMAQPCDAARAYQPDDHERTASPLH
jgi:hypothetical protein